MTEIWQLRDYYDLLEVDRQASREEIQRSYHLQAMVWAPDRFQGYFKKVAEQRLLAINKAWEELQDKKRREHYDKTLLPAETEAASFPEPLQNVPNIWKRMAGWMKDEDVGTPYQRRMAFTAGDLLERRQQPSEKQRPWMQQAWEVAIGEGFDPEADDVE